MKVLVCIPNDVLGGAEQFLKKIVLWHLQNGHHVCILFLTSSKTVLWNDVRRFSSSRLIYTDSSVESLGFLRIAVNLFGLRDNYFDYSYTSHVHLTGLVGLFRSLGVVKVGRSVARESTLIFQRFSGLKLFIFKAFYLLGYRQIDLLICQTAEMRRDLLLSMPKLFYKIKVEVIANPFDFPDRGLLKGELDNELRDKQIIVAAGRLIYEKGFDLLLKAFALVKRSNAHLNLVILGDGRELNNLLELSKELEIDDSVFFKGYVENVYLYFSKAKLCVLSSRVEGFPNALLQMMSVNGNVVSTCCADGIRDIVGLYFSEVNSVESLKDAICNALSLPDNESNYFKDYLNGRSTSDFVKRVQLLLK